MSEEILKRILSSEYKDYSDKDKIYFLLQKYSYLLKCNLSGEDEILKQEELEKIKQELTSLGAIEQLEENTK